MVDFSIPQVQVPNIAGMYQAGQEAGRENALRAAMQQYGGAAAMGDQNALRALAQYDPQAALDLMSGRQQMDLRSRADDRNERQFGLEQQRSDQTIAESNQRMDLARQEARMATEQHKAKMTAAERENAMQEIQLIGGFANVGDEAQWDALADQLQLPEFKGQFAKKDELVGMAQGVSEALAGPGEQFTLSPGEERFDGRGNQIAAVPDGPETTDDITEYNAAVAQGFGGNLQDWMAQNRQRNVTVPPPQAGYRYVYDDAGNPVSAEPIPGTPAAREAALAEQAFDSQSGRREVSSDTIMKAAKSARDLIGGWSTGVTGQVMGNIKQSDAGEINRQVDVLKSNATIENLQAMRASSPTGAALGSVTAQENQMLATAAGALDPAAGPVRFRKALDNYERTLLRIVHGPEKGDEIFLASRAGDGPAGASTTGSGVNWKLLD